MLDSKLLRTNLDAVVANLKRRGFDFDVEQYHSLEQQRSHLQTQTQTLQATRNRVSKQIGILKSKGENTEDVLKEVADLGDQLKACEQQLSAVLEALEQYLLYVPNCLDDSVPDGRSEADNVEIHKWGELPVFDFQPKDHIELGAGLEQMDFDTAAKMSGARFVILKHGIARMQRALAQFMLDLHINEHGYAEVYVPFLVQSKALYGTGQLPKFKEEQFVIGGDWDMVLIPTAEVPLTNLVRDVVIEAEQLPLKYVAHTPSFRSEAGSYGKDTRGMIRQHQFEKVEMVQIVKPEQSMRALEEMLGHAQTVLERLELPYRTVRLCSGDIGFSALKTYDVEVWLPGQDRYREISSVSNTGDFQARRLQARWRNPHSKKPELVHTLNGSGLAVGRTLVAVMENYQQHDGSIRVPKVLQPYMGGLSTIPCGH